MDLFDDETLFCYCPHCNKETWDFDVSSMFERGITLHCTDCGNVSIDFDKGRNEWFVSGTDIPFMPYKENDSVKALKELENADINEAEILRRKIPLLMDLQSDYGRLEMHEKTKEIDDELDRCFEDAVRLKLKDLYGHYVHHLQSISIEDPSKQEETDGIVQELLPELDLAALQDALLFEMIKSFPMTSQSSILVKTIATIAKRKAKAGPEDGDYGKYVLDAASFIKTAGMIGQYNSCLIIQKSVEKQLEKADIPERDRTVFRLELYEQLIENPLSKADKVRIVEMIRDKVHTLDDGAVNQLYILLCIGDNLEQMETGDLGDRMVNLFDAPNGSADAIAASNARLIRYLINGDPQDIIRAAELVEDDPDYDTEDFLDLCEYILDDPNVPEDIKKKYETYFDYDDEDDEEER